MGSRDGRTFNCIRNGGPLIIRSVPSESPPPPARLAFSVAHAWWCALLAVCVPGDVALTSPTRLSDGSPWTPASHHLQFAFQLQIPFQFPPFTHFPSLQQVHFCPEFLTATRGGGGGERRQHPQTPRAYLHALITLSARSSRFSRAWSHFSFLLRGLHREGNVCVHQVWVLLRSLTGKGDRARGPGQGRGG